MRIGYLTKQMKTVCYLCNYKFRNPPFNGVETFNNLNSYFLEASNYYKHFFYHNVFKVFFNPQAIYEFFNFFTKSAMKPPPLPATGVIRIKKKTLNIILFW